MSGKGGGGGGNSGWRKGSSGIADIPAGSRKMVQSLKEILNCPEAEIYAALKECNMEPNEAVNRLLAQDPFREVRSKRDKKKESKDTTDSRPRGATNISSRGARGNAASRGGTTQFGANDSSGLHGRPAFRKDSGAQVRPGFTSSVTTERQPPPQSDFVATGTKISPSGWGDGLSSSSQPSSAQQSARFGAPGQVSMADIVKMGRPHNKGSAFTQATGQNVSHLQVNAPPSAVPHHDLHSSQNCAPKMSEIEHEQGVYATQRIPPRDEWPLIDKPAATSVSSILKTPGESGLCTDPLSDRINEHLHSQLDEVHVAENGPVGTVGVDKVQPTSVSHRSLQEDGSGRSSPFDDQEYQQAGSYHTHGHDAEDSEDQDDTSSVAADVQHLSIENHDREASFEEDRSGVIIPTHLQVHTPECSHLSFGSFGPGIRPALSGPFASRSSNGWEEASEGADASSSARPDIRNNEFYGEELLQSTSDGNMVPLTNTSSGNFERSSDSQREVIKHENHEVTDNAFSSPVPGYTYENNQQLNAAIDPPQASAEMQNLASFSSVMQAYTNSLPSTLLPQTVPSGRALDLQYSPFPVTQSMPIKYSSAASSLSGPAMSVPEALRVGGTSASQPAQQSVSGANVATGPTLPQVAMHPYSQPTLPLGHYANIIGYPLLPQNYPYMPSAFQQAFSGNTSYLQSLAAMLPQYKSNVPASSLPQSAAAASGYGFGSSGTVPGGNFPLNTVAPPVSATIGYDDVLNPAYKDTNHLMSLQQTESSGLWLHGPGSRTMSTLPGSNYYSLQGQIQQPHGFRQAQQQPSQQLYGSLGYPNIYQTGISFEHQQLQNPREGSIGGSQVQAPKQTQQIWQNNY